MLSTFATVPVRSSRVQRQARMTARSQDELSAMVLPCGGTRAEGMLPGDSGWLHVIDEHRAFVLRAARQSPFNGLLAQQLAPASCITNTVVPLLRLFPSRRLDMPGALVEVVCVGRAVVQNAGTGDLQIASLSLHVDDPPDKADEHHDEMRDLRSLITMYQEASLKLDLKAPSSGAAATMPSIDEGDVPSELKAFLRTPVDQLIDERRYALRRRALGPDVDSDAEMLSYAACCCLHSADDRAQAVQSSSTRERLQLCIEHVRARHDRLAAKLAIDRAFASA